MLTYLYILTCNWSKYLILPCPNYQRTVRTMMDFILTVFIKARPKSTKWAYTDSTEYRSTDSICSNFICHIGCNYVLTVRALNFCWKHASLSWWRVLMRNHHDRLKTNHNLREYYGLRLLLINILLLNILWVWLELTIYLLGLNKLL
jgi:hypothetical protein